MSFSSSFLFFLKKAISSLCYDVFFKSYENTTLMENNEDSDELNNKSKNMKNFSKYLVFFQTRDNKINKFKMKSTQTKISLKMLKNMNNYANMEII
jgi:hypothetical protein